MQRRLDRKPLVAAQLQAKTGFVQQLRVDACGVPSNGRVVKPDANHLCQRKVASGHIRRGRGRRERVLHALRHETNRLEAKYMRASSLSGDHSEAVEAFLSKRQPKFKGN